MQCNGHGALYEPHVREINNPVEPRNLSRKRDGVCLHVEFLWEERPRTERVTNTPKAYEGNNESPDGTAEYGKAEYEEDFAHTRVSGPCGGLYFARSSGFGSVDIFVFVSVFNTAHGPSFYMVNFVTTPECIRDVERRRSPRMDICRNAPRKCNDTLQQERYT